MKSFSFLFPILIPSIALVEAPYHSYALSSRDVGSIAEAITVRIDGQNPGSGVVIKKQGRRYTVLTAAHVVATEDEYEIVTPDDKSYLLDYKTVKKFPGIDLALVEFTSSKSYPVVEVGDSNEVRSGDAVYVSGFPMPTAAITEPIWNFSPGSVTANARRALADGYALVYTNNTLPGMSGGAVLNEQGKLIGIHGRADQSEEFESDPINEYIALKTGFNLGIPINTFRRVVPKVDSQLGFAQPVSPTPQAPTASDFVLVAGDRLSKRDFQSALENLDRAIELNPNKARSYLYRGISQRGLRNEIGAIADFNRAIQLDPKINLAFRQRGISKRAVGDKTGAIADFNKAIQLDPNDSIAYTQRGLVKGPRGDNKGALADFNQAIQLNPKNALAYSGRGIIKMKLQNFPEARADLKHSLVFAPEDPKVYKVMGLISILLKENHTAIQELDQAIRLNPNDPDAFNFRCHSKMKVRDKQGALQDCSMAVQLFRAQGKTAQYNKAVKKLKSLRTLPE